MRANVDLDYCGECGLCVHLCPEVFQRGGGSIQVVGKSIPVECEGSCKKAQKSCPCEAIGLN